MKDKDKPRIPGGKKKHGDFSSFAKKKKSPSKFPKKTRESSGARNSKPGSDRTHEEGERKFDKKFDKKSKSTSFSHSDKFKRKRSTKPNDYVVDGGLIRLNKYIAHSGVCSRREADTLIQTGAVMVNGKIVTELGTKIKPTDKVQIGDQTLVSETLRYLVLNKPKGYITTTDDPEKRNTVMMLIDGACKERIYPVGRLDRNTIGLLLFTNDGEMAKKLTHPSSNIKKIYHVHTDKNVNGNDLDRIAEGIKLDDGFIKPDAIDFVGDGKDKKQIGIELHSGKNRIVRRIFESMDYNVVRLDRVFFAGLNKKDLPRSKWRFLTNEEINILKMLK